MKDFVKKIYVMAASAVLVVLLLLTTVFSAGTIVTIRNAENQMTDVYKLGSFTHNVTVDRSEFGVNTVVSFFKNFKYYKLIISVQNIEAQIRYEEKRIQEYIALGLTSSTDYSDEIKGCRDNIAKCRVEIDGHMNTLTEEEKTLLTDELMKDEDFIYPLGAFYTIYSMGAGDTYGNSPEHIDDAMFNVASWLSFFLMIITLLMAVIIFVVFAVTTVTKIIYLATHIMKADATVVEKCCFKTDAAALMIMVLAGMFSAIFGNSVAFGSGLIGVIVCVILSAVVTGISRVLLADKFSFGEIAKVAISVVSVILLTVMVFSFFNIGIFGTTSDYASDYAKEEYLYKVEYEKRFEQYKPDESIIVTEGPFEYAEDLKAAHERAENEAWLVVRDTYAKKQALALAYDAIASLVVVIIYIVFITRLGARDVIDRRTGQLAKQPSGMPVAAVLLIAIMIIPSVFFAVPSNDAKIESYNKGEFKIYFDAYAEEGTDEANAVAFLKEGRETVDKGLAELDEQIEKATDEKVKADLIFAREDGQRMLNLIDDNIEILTTSKSGAIATGTTMSIILLILCVAYMIVPQVLDKALAGVFAKNEAFEAQNVEEKKDEE